MALTIVDREGTVQGKTYGRLDPALRWSCGYMERATDPAHMVPARWHGVILGSDEAMSCCDEHRNAMALSADYVHELGSACFLPGSVFIWPENVCVLKTDVDQMVAMLREEATW